LPTLRDETTGGAVLAGRRTAELMDHWAELEIVRVIDTPEATHIRFRVRG
jgi:hypothetical protein